MTCLIFSLSLSLRARASVSAALLERKLAMKLAIFSKSGMSKSTEDLMAATGGLILLLLRLHLGDHLEHLFKLVHVHLVVVHAKFVVVLALHHVIRHHLLTHERIIILHVGHHLREGHHHLELVHLVIHVVIVVLVVGVVLIIIVIVLHVWSGLISSVVV